MSAGLPQDSGRDTPWWERGVIYQVYPRSFQDSDGDGVGDLAGIEARLDHLAALGVDAIWLSPIFPSPMADFGYDIADYCGIEPVFGDLAAFDRLLAAAHARGLKLLLDFVPNHSSDRHPWFVKSRASRHNSKRDWYIWRDGSAYAQPGFARCDDGRAALLARPWRRRLPDRRALAHRQGGGPAGQSGQSRLDARPDRA
jgi:glycosidase